MALCATWCPVSLRLFGERARRGPRDAGVVSVTRAGYIRGYIIHVDGIDVADAVLNARFIDLRDLLTHSGVRGRLRRVGAVEGMFSIGLELICLLV